MTRTAKGFWFENNLLLNFHVLFHFFFWKADNHTNYQSLDFLSLLHRTS